MARDPTAMKFCISISEREHIALQKKQCSHTMERNAQKKRIT
jgi:hypothetical protein